ncbi:hypothetical protein [Brevundimonas sp. UBA7664]|uniref:hypothetical protein n=1 Tax=Brevundimonas sp. UBA7664 TaxID=1946141 RepID=UPI0025BF2ED3|nr:hypothetical protein [Brevundimonas sp. UBA7664]
MTYLPTYDLPPSLIATLGPLGDALRQTTPDQLAIRRCVRALEELPPSDVDRAYRALGVWVNMVEWTAFKPPGRPRSILDWLFGAPKAPAAGMPRRPNRTKAFSQMARTPGLEVIFLFCPDGYIREAALNRLTAASSPFVLTAVAYRLNDWVEAVRAAARNCAARVFHTAPVAAVAEAALFLMDRKSFWKRGESELALLDDAFSRADVVEALAGLILTGRTGLVSRAYSHGLATDLLDHRLIEFATQAASPAVRAIAARTLINGEARRQIGFERRWIDKTYNIGRRAPLFSYRPIQRPQLVEDLIAMVARDRSPAVRRVAAEGLVRFRRDIAGPEPLLAMLRNDRAPSIRQRVAFVERDLGLEIDTASRSKDP